MNSVIQFAGGCLLTFICFFHPSAQALTADDLRSDIPACKSPQTTHPKLPVDFEHDAPIEIVADFNGDGWCDYALGVSYPINSQMNSYTLPQLMALGGAAGWTSALHGKPWAFFPLDKYPSGTWPIFQVDLTDIRLVYPKTYGAPYVLGLFAGKDGEGKESVGGSGCSQYVSVHRWDDKVGAFRRVDDAIRDVVLKYFYTAVEKPCPLPQNR